MKTRSKQRPRTQGNPDLRRQCQWPALEIPQMVEELRKKLNHKIYYKGHANYV